MTTINDTATIRRQLQEVEDKIAEQTRERLKSLSALEGERDKLLNRLLDNEGAHDRRPVAVR
jgi:hypothetical protein